MPPLLLVCFISAGTMLALAIGLVLALLVFGGGKKKNQPAVAIETPATVNPGPGQPLRDSPRINDDLGPVRARRFENVPDTDDRTNAPPEQIVTPLPEKQRLSPEEQQRVDAAIDKGLTVLSQYQARGFAPGHPVGLAAITGLTMLECGFGPGDARVLRAADYVRQHAPSLHDGATTYQISLSLLFLDRLGDSRDEKLIRTMGLRLVAGQAASGGWTYHLPQIQADVERKFLQALQLNRPLDSGKQLPAERVPGIQLPTERTDSALRPATIPKGAVPNPQDSDSDPSPQLPPDPKAARRAVATLPAELRKVPALAPSDAQGTGIWADADNSNTQFATLALWVAGRHGVPIERSMALLGQRFRTTQAPDGTWGYQSNHGAASSAMTGAGLLGLAVAHGVGPDRAPGDGKPIKDEQIQKGLAAFGQSVGKPLGAARKTSRRGAAASGVNLYFLWSLERVAVLYRLETLNGMDWYTWGAELLVDSQQADGSWGPSGYPGSQPIIDTCFALLFLKRANLARDLAQKLENVLDAKDPGTGR